MLVEQKLCPFCEVAFPSDQIKDHIGTEHLGFMSKSINQTESTILHSEHSEEFTIKKEIECQKSQKLYPCKQCDKVYTTRHGILAHRRSIHEGIRHLCPNCNMKFTSKGRLKCHVKSIHDKIKDKTCDECGKKFVDGTTLNEHIKVVHLKYQI